MHSDFMSWFAWYIQNKTQLNKSQLDIVKSQLNQFKAGKEEKPEAGAIPVFVDFNKNPVTKRSPSDTTEGKY